MSAELFTDAMSQISDKYVTEALTHQRAERGVGMERRSNRKWLIVAALVAALMLVGFTVAPKIIEMINGRVIEWDNNHLHTSGTSKSMAEVRDGRVYFTLDNSDITEYCSETTYFRYDFTDEQGIVHVILIGGEMDKIGWTEILFFENGKRLSHSNLMTDGTTPAWYEKGNADVNEDYGYVPPDRDYEHSYEYEIEPEEVEN